MPARHTTAATTTATTPAALGPPSAALLDLASRMASADDVETLLLRVAESALTLTGADATVVMSRDGWAAAGAGSLSAAPAMVAAVVNSPCVASVMAVGGSVLITGESGPVAAALLGAFGRGQRAIIAPMIGMGDHDGAIVAVGHAMQLEAHGAAMEGAGRLAGTILDRLVELRRSDRRADVDPASGLLNRAAFERYLAAAGAESRGIAAAHLGGLEAVATSFGDGATAVVLTTLAQRLEALWSVGTVARIGLADVAVSLKGEVGAAADQLLAALSQPFTVGRRAVVLAPHVGYSITVPGVPARSTLQRAETACNHARSSRRPLVGHTSELTASVHERLALLSRLREGIAQHELVVRYQPQVLADGTLVASEALVRWAGPEGEVQPGAFLAVAEESGLIVDIDLFVLRTACRQVARWQDNGLALRVAVNFSATTLSRPTIVGEVLAAVAAAGIAPSSLEIEITETLAGDEVAWLGALAGLRERGVQVAIDDFGTGHSSLARLRRLPVDRLKIDRSFVDDVTGAGGAVIDAIISLGRALGITVIAEGVEDELQFSALRDLGCQEMQGYLIGRPGTPEALAELARLRLLAASPATAGAARSSDACPSSPV